MEEYRPLSARKVLNAQVAGHNGGYLAATVRQTSQMNSNWSARSKIRQKCYNCNKMSHFAKGYTILQRSCNKHLRNKNVGNAKVPHQTVNENINSKEIMTYFSLWKHTTVLRIDSR